MHGLSFFNEEECSDFGVVLEIVEAFCVGETNKIYERYQFNKRGQESAESIDSYVATLRTLAKTWNYGSLLDSIICDRIFVGIRDNSTRRRLRQESKLPLTRGIDICRSSEATAVQLQAVTNYEDLKFVADGKPKSTSSEDTKLPAKGNKAAIPCKFCGDKQLGVEQNALYGKRCATVVKRKTHR